MDIPLDQEILFASSFPRVLNVFVKILWRILHLWAQKYLLAALKDMSGTQVKYSNALLVEWSVFRQWQFIGDGKCTALFSPKDILLTWHPWGVPKI